MRHRLLSFALMTLCAVPLAAVAQTVTRLDGSTITPAEIDGTVTRLMKAAEVTGVGIAVLDHGKVAYLKAFGFRDPEKKLPLTTDSVLSAASFTKVAFGYLAMQLVDEGVLDLDRPVYQYLPKPLPEYPKYADLADDPRYKAITARMLLSHTSGFPNWRAFEENRKLKIHFAPGSRFAYSGEGIDLLQFIVEAITKKGLNDLMEERVFRPLGMTRTSMLWQDRFETDYANGYDEYGRSLGPQRRTKADAAGSMLTTINDFARFVQAVVEGRQIRARTRDQMLSPQVPIASKHQFPTFSAETTEENKAIRLSYGLAWGLYWTPLGKVFFKEGHDDGWRNYTAVFDQQKSGIVIMTNSSNGEGIFKELLETLLKDTFTPIEWEGYTSYDKLPPRPRLTEHKRVQVDPKILDRYAGRYAISPEIMLVIRHEGDHLSVQENDEPKQDLLPESETKFFSTLADDVFAFQTDTQGRVTGMLLNTGDKKIAIKRIE